MKPSESESEPPATLGAGEAEATTRKRGHDSPDPPAAATPSPSSGSKGVSISEAIARAQKIARQARDSKAQTCTPSAAAASTKAAGGAPAWRPPAQGAGTIQSSLTGGNGGGWRAPGQQGTPGVNSVQSALAKANANKSKLWGSGSKTETGSSAGAGGSAPDAASGRAGNAGVWATKGLEGDSDGSQHVRFRRFEGSAVSTLARLSTRWARHVSCTLTVICGPLNPLQAKFMKLMGAKKAGVEIPTTAPKETSASLLNNLESQYNQSRMFTHGAKGAGLGMYSAAPQAPPPSQEQHQEQQQPDRWRDPPKSQWKNQH